VTRNEKILAHIPRRAKILEIGPGYSPVLTRSSGWDVYTLDHASADELRSKYANADVDTSRIEAVDFIWRGGPLELAVPPIHHGTFDACIGSHLIEHMPDIISFFQSLRRLVTPAGVVSLVVPDKRFCFDFFQPITMTGDVLEAYRAKRDRHTSTAVFNAATNMVRAGGLVSWGQQPTGPLTFEDGNLQAANESFFAKDESHEYRDVHGWYFTPSSFRLIIMELGWMGHIDFAEISRAETVNCEFFVTLGFGKPKLTDDQFRTLRMDLLINILLEFREQTDFLIDGSNFVGRLGR